MRVMYLQVGFSQRAITSKHFHLDAGLWLGRGGSESSSSALFMYCFPLLILLLSNRSMRITRFSPQCLLFPYFDVCLSRITVGKVVGSTSRSYFPLQSRTCGLVTVPESGTMSGCSSDSLLRQVNREASRKKASLNHVSRKFVSVSSHSVTPPLFYLFLPVSLCRFRGRIPFCETFRSCLNGGISPPTDTTARFLRARQTPSFGGDVDTQRVVLPSPAPGGGTCQRPPRTSVGFRGICGCDPVSCRPSPFLCGCGPRSSRSFSPD